MCKKKILWNGSTDFCTKCSSENYFSMNSGKHLKYIRIWNEEVNLSHFIERNAIRMHIRMPDIQTSSLCLGISLSVLLECRRYYQRRHWHPPPVLLPGKSHGWRSLVGCSPCDRKESDTTERLHFHFSLSLFTFMHWRRKWQPTPVFLPGESQGQGSQVGCRLWGHTESNTTEVT